MEYMLCSHSINRRVQKWSLLGINISPCQHAMLWWQAYSTPSWMVSICRAAQTRPARNQFLKVWLRYPLPPPHTSVHLSSFCGFGSDDSGGCGGGGGIHSSTEWRWLEINLERTNERMDWIAVITTKNTKFVLLSLLRPRELCAEKQI